MLPNQPQAPYEPVPTWTEWGISVLNGMFGDYLRERQNGLAITMAFYHQNHPLSLTTAGLQQAHVTLSNKLCVLLHGLGCHEGVWTFRDPAQRTQGLSYGTLLQQELGYTPFYLRYNTGLPVADNGKDVAALLDELLTGYPADVTEIVLIGHSMGGLVLRSACHYGAQHQYEWVKKVKQVFYLGTPHEGADLEKLGHMTTAVLHAVPNPITRLIGTVLNRRSQGIKDLRLGNPLVEEWPEVFPSASGDNNGQVIPWLASANHYLIVGTLTADLRHPVALLFGDALVRLPRVHHHPVPEGEPRPAPNHYVKIFPKLHHMSLARHPKVYQQIKQWCTNESRGDNLCHGYRYSNSED